MHVHTSFSMRKPAEPLGTPRNTLGNPCGTPAEPLLPERRRRTFLTTRRLHGDLLRLPGRSTQTEDENVRGLFQPVVLLEIVEVRRRQVHGNA